LFRDTCCDILMILLYICVTWSCRIYDCSIYVLINRVWQAVSLVTNRPKEWTYLPPLVFGFSCYLIRRVGIRVAGQPGVRSCSRSTDVRPAHLMCVWSCSRLWWLWSTSRNERQTVARNHHWMFQACELGLPLQGWNSIQESSVSCGDWDCLIPLPYRVTRATWWLSNVMFG
jgi:hypothetical protein